MPSSRMSTLCQKERDGACLPFAGTVKDGRLYGRGATDDKGPAIASIFALAAARAALQAQHIEPKNAIMLLFGTDEESGWSDVDYYFKNMVCPKPVSARMPNSLS